MTNVSENQKIRLFFSLLICMLLILAPQSSFAASPSDIESHWAKNQIQGWLDKGIVSGYPDGTFKPDATISRAEFMSIVNNAFGYTAEMPTQFSDVKTDAWYFDVLTKAAAAKYISGYADGTMKPDRPISREEAAVIIANISKLQANKDGISKLSDIASIKWSDGSVGAVATACLMTGYPDGSFKPQGIILRGEAVAALEKARSFSTMNASNQTLTGYIMDEHCFVKKPVPGSDTKVCLQMPTCAATGYGIAVAQNDGSYRFYYFDGAFAPNATNSQAKAVQLINDTVKKDHIAISVTGKMNGDFKTAADGFSYLILSATGMTE